MGMSAMRASNLAALLYLWVVAGFRRHPQTTARRHHSPLPALQATLDPSVTVSINTNDKTPHPPQLQQSSNTPLERLIDDKFIPALRAALQGDQSQLDALTRQTSAGSAWDNPFVSTLAEAKESLRQLSSFFLDPSITVFSVRETATSSALVEYQLGLTYPLPWRPRVVIHAKALITASADLTQITSVRESWDNSVFDLFRKQVLPRLWDIWHLFASPVPEYPPLKHLGTIGKVTFAEFPPSIVYEARWSGLAKYPGPPLQTLPGFAFIGNLQTSKPNRDPFYTVLPVETSSDSFVCPQTKKEMKRTSWILPIPSQFHHHVIERARMGAVVPIKPSEVEFNDINKDDEDPDQTDVKVNNLDNVNIMRSVTQGAQRGASLRFDEQKVEEFLASEKTEGLYRITPRRYFAQVDVPGEVTPDKIAAAIAVIREAVQGQNREVLASGMISKSGGQKASSIKMRRRTADSQEGTHVADSADDKFTPQIGLLISNCKACFNAKGELAMAIYEIQFGNKLTRVQVELDATF